MYVVNEIGMAEIAEFLRAEHKFGNELSWGCVSAWADWAEFQLGIGNPASIEIRACDAICGHAIEYRISDAGLSLLDEDWESSIS